MLSQQSAGNLLDTQGASGPGGKDEMRKMILLAGFSRKTRSMENTCIITQAGLLDRLIGSEAGDLQWPSGQKIQ